MTEFRSRRPPETLAWCDQRVIELLRTSMHPAPRLFPPLDEDAESVELRAARLQRDAAIATVDAGPRAGRLLSWCTNLWVAALR